MGNLDLIKNRAWTKDDYTVSSTMQNYFANFIIHGNPNGSNLPEWPAAAPTDETPPVMIIDVQSKILDAKDDARYLFLDRVYKNN
jgi:para-nitrobenzyl esterase